MRKEYPMKKHYLNPVCICETVLQDLLTASGEGPQLSAGPGVGDVDEY